MSSLPPFPRLRPEVSIVPFFSSAKEETYLVLLPDGRSLQTTRRLYELITCLDGSRNIEELARTLSGTWNCSIRPADVREWIDRYLVPHDLLAPAPDLPPPVPSPPAKSPSTKGIMLIPGRLAHPLTRRLRLLFHPLCSVPFLWASALCHGLIYLDLLSGTETGLISSIPPSVYLIGYLVIFLSVLFHEFGHLSACQYFDCPHGEIRLGFYLVFPVFYANVSPAWRLERKARVVVDLAGMYFQLLVTLPVSLLFHLTREPIWLFLFLELDAMILFSLNPFLRFDGYWLCSDLLGVPNLRSRSQLLMKTLWNRLCSRASLPATPLLDITPGARLGLALYAIGSYLFGGLVFVFFCSILPARIQTFPSEVKKLMEDGLGDWSQGNTTGMLLKLLQIFFLCVMLLAAGRMLAKVIPTAVEAARALLRKTWGLPGKHPPQG
jgi:putative peptide zinc metalloprotease protein